MIILMDNKSTKTKGESKMKTNKLNNDAIPHCVNNNSHILVLFNSNCI